MKDDRLISLNAAIDAMMKLQAEDIEAYGASIPEGFDGDRAVTALKALPSAQPTLYGYSIESLAAVAEIMKKGGMSPEEALWTYKNNVQRIAELIRAEWYENVQKQLEQMVFSGGQEE